MRSKPITQKAGTKYGSLPVNQEVTVDAEGTTPAKFPRMSPLKQTEITDLVDSNDYSPNYITVGGDQNVTPDPGLNPIGIGPGPSNAGVSYSNKFSQYDPTAIYPTVSAVNPPKVETGLKVDDKPDEPKKVSDNPLIQGAADVGKTSSQSVKVDVGTGETFTPMGSGSLSTSSDGQFLGPRERRERMRGVKFSANQKLRQNMSDARAEADKQGLSGKERRDFLKNKRAGFKEERRSSITAEAERQMNTNQDSLRSKINKRSTETQLSNLKNEINTQSKLSGVSDKTNSVGLDYSSSAPSLTNKKVGMFGKYSSGSNNSSTTSSFRDKVSNINQQAKSQASNTNLFEENKSFGNAMDFARNIENVDFSGKRGSASNTAYVDKTGRFMDNEMMRAMSPNQKRGNVGRGYKMGGYGTKNK